MKERSQARAFLRRVSRLTVAALLWGSAAVSQDSPERPYLPIGLFLGRIEEGARIFTPARLFPVDHPEAGGHAFPTVQQLHGNEFSALLWLGRQAGLGLWATLQRYPREPDAGWPYPDFRQPPDTGRLGATSLVRRPAHESPLPGLRAVLYDGPALVVFIVDTRLLSLAERHMSEPTTMGLDIGRAEFLKALDQAGRLGGMHGLHAVIFDP